MVKWDVTRIQYVFDNSLRIFLNCLAEEKPSFFIEVIEMLMCQKLMITVNDNCIDYPVKNNLVPLLEFYSCINRYDYPQKNSWKQAFFASIEIEYIDDFFVQEFVGLIISTNTNFYTYDLGSFAKFNSAFIKVLDKLPKLEFKHSNIISYLTEILLSKTDSIRISLGHTFCKDCSSFFTDNLGLLKQVYFYKTGLDRHYDYDGKELEIITKLDKNFVVEYIKERTKDLESALDLRHDELHIGFIWDMTEYESLSSQILDVIIERVPMFSNFEHVANSLFTATKNREDLIPKAYSLISKKILEYLNSKDHIAVIFNIVCYSFNKSVLVFLKEFLLLNKDLSFIQSLWMEQNGVITGSRVPKIEGHITFLTNVLEMVKTLPNPLEYSEHIKFWEESIEWAKKDKQSEMVRDFKGWAESY
ncbi:MAG: hypothetical protein K2Q22_13320 [Cytophagales bacterium]|nr:hypothetical protein [Cytophagales bacterium]